VGNRTITLLFAKLYGDQMIEIKKYTEAQLPNSIPELAVSYVCRVNRNLFTNHNHVNGESYTHHEALRDAKLVAWLCIMEKYKIDSCKYQDAEDKFGGGDDANKRLNYLERKLKLIKTVQNNRIRFTIDPIAEYLAGLYLIDAHSKDENKWKDFREEAKDKLKANSSEAQTIRSFLNAVYDCCNEKYSGVSDYTKNEIKKLAE
jgi:hypothetical protein